MIRLIVITAALLVSGAPQIAAQACEVSVTDRRGSGMK